MKESLSAITFPITKIDKDQWNRKVNACLMYTIPSEDEALPTLILFEEILERLMDPQQSLSDVLSQDLVEYFFVNVFTISCQKIIKSRYFKNQTVLKKANRILEMSVCLLALYPDVLDKCPQFIEVFQSVFPNDEFYFKTNNQMTHQTCPLFYFKNKEQKENLQKLPFDTTYKVDQKVDVLKFVSSDSTLQLPSSQQYSKFIWSHGTIIQVQKDHLIVSYDLDYKHSTVKIDEKNFQYMIAPFESKCSASQWEWRSKLKKGDLVDALDSFGAWYNATVLSVTDQEDGRKQIQVTLKVYHELGNKVEDQQNVQIGSNQRGSKLKYFGFADYNETYCAYSAQVSEYCSIAKQFNYDSSKSQFDYIDDFNDMALQEVNGERIYALPRKKYLSELIFNSVNRFGRLGGFEKVMNKIQHKKDIAMLSSFLKGLSGVEAYLHKGIVIELLDKIRALLEGDILSDSNTYTKQKSEMLFSGFRALLKRIYTTETAYQFENSLKIKLVEQNFEHDSLKKKLLGLNELKQIVKSLTYGSARNKKIIEWIKEQRIFEKVYLINSHVQLIKKSESFFRYIINENILEVQDLEKLLKMAQKGDYQTRISLYSLFQEVSHIFKKHHVDFLIDKILESEPGLILNEDMDLLHELSRYSNYFPTTKVMAFFEKLTLGEQIPPEINAYAIKKYTDIVAKNHEMRPFRKELIRDLLQKMKEPKQYPTQKVAKILKLMFQHMGFGQWGRKELSQMLVDEEFDTKIIESIHEGTSSFKNQQTSINITREAINLLLGIYDLCSTYKIHIATLDAVWQQIQSQQQQSFKFPMHEFYQWINKAIKCEQGIETEKVEEFQQFFQKLFLTKAQISNEPKESPSRFRDMKIEELDLVIGFFTEINKRRKLLTVSNVMKDKNIQKQYRRKCPLKQLRFLDTIRQIMECAVDQKVTEKVTDFYVELYSSGDNSQQQIDEMLSESIQNLKKQTAKIQSLQEPLHQQEKESNEFLYKSTLQTLKLISLIIDDSEKSCSSHVDSLISKKSSHEVKLNIINSVSTYLSNHSSDTVKKMQVTIPVNFTLYDLRAHLAKELDIPSNSVQIEYNNDKKQIPFLKNCRTIKELGLTGMETLVVTRRTVNITEPEADIIVDGEINPKAIRAFQMIFDQYAVDNVMNKAQCHEFTIKCLGNSSSPKFYETKINELFRDYDENHDDLLTFDDFLRFYKDAAESRSSTVWSNLKSFGVRGNFKFTHEPDDEIDTAHLPRIQMSKRPEIYDMLFRLLREKKLASLAFDLLERLPVSTHMEKQILSVGEEEFNFEEMLNSEDLYIFYYKLNIINSLVQANDQNKTQQEQDWVCRFVSCQGFQQLMQKFFGFLQRYDRASNSRKVELEIIDSLIELLEEYLIKSFLNPKKLKCLALLGLDASIDDQVEYLVTGAFPNKQHEQKLQSIEQELTSEKIEQSFTIEKFSKKEISENLLNVLMKLWPDQPSHSCEQSSPEVQFLELAVTKKILVVVPVVLIDEDLSYFMSKMEGFINKCEDVRKLKFFYSLIVCIAFYSQSGQKVIVNQMFRHLTTKNIISDHFGILAVLVSKYGISEVNQEEIVGVLSENIFNSHSELTIEGCSKLMLHFELENIINEAEFDRVWDECLFNEDEAKRIGKNSTRQALFDLLLKSTHDKPRMTDYIIGRIQQKIAQCFQHMRITSCVEDNQKSSLGLVGLKNLGNTCYINSMMQQLFMNANFRYLISRIQDHEPEAMELYKEKLYDDNILHQFQRTFAYLEKTSRADFVPSGFCLAYKPFGESVNVMVQQDVQQFVSMFFDQLENKIKVTPFRSVLDTFYKGKTTNLFTCHDCHQTKKVEENFYSISLEVKNSKSLGDSFNRYISGELISDFRCSFCEKKVDVSKQTRISKPPHTLIIHLQRIVFNLDTFVNEKITTRHEFPMNLNLYPYSLNEFESKKDSSSKKQQNEANTEKQSQEEEQSQENELERLKASMDYNLSGIICHIGNAESGHYISYIKQPHNDKWIEFNDSLVMSFNSSNIESECFGGFTSVSSFADEFEWDKTNEATKSAYVLLYEKQGSADMQVFLDAQQDKEAFLKEYDLKEVIEKIKHTEEQQQCSEGQRGEAENVKKSKLGHGQKENQGSDSSLSGDEDSDDPQAREQKLRKEMKRMEENQIIRKKSQQIQLELIDKSTPELDKEAGSSEQKAPELIPVKIEEDISFYLLDRYRKEIDQDNSIHFFERNLASPAFITFFANLLKQKHTCHDGIVQSFKELTFGFWLKSKSFKELLKTCTQFIENDLKYADDFIFSNTQQITTLLIENSDADVRTAISQFLANSFDLLIKKYQLQLGQPSSEIDGKIVEFLDNLFALIPTKVSKCWTKFGQYFEFWYEFANKGEVQLKYCVKREVLKHFLDYYLDKKSPLRIYKDKPEIGSRYASPNFSYLLKTVTYLISEILKNNAQCKQCQYRLSQDDYTILIHFECMEKLIAQSYENLAVSLVKEICKNNLYASEKIAIVLLKGLHRATFNNVQPYLDVLHAYILIEDKHQLLRMKWVMGRAKLNCSINPQTKHPTIEAMSAYSLEERVYTYHSSISLEQASSLLDPIHELYRRAENFSMMSLKAALKLCQESEFVFEYVWNLPPPNLCYGNVFNFYGHFINRYIEEAKRSHSFSHVGFNKEQLGTYVKGIYYELIDRKVKQSLKNAQEEVNRSSGTAVEQERVQNSDQKPISQNQQSQNLQEKSSENREITSSQQLKTTNNDQRVTETQKDNEQNNHQTSAAQNPAPSSSPSSHQQQKQIPTKILSNIEEERHLYQKAFYPVSIQNLKQIQQTYEMNGLKILKQEMQIVMLELQPNGKGGNDSISATGMKKNFEKIKQQAWQTKRTETVRAYLIFNDSKSLLRIQTNEGTQLIKINDRAWVWAEEILKVWECQRGEDWPTWALHQLSQEKDPKTLTNKKQESQKE